MITRAPDLEVDLSGAAHPSRSARKEMRRFLATRAIALVEDAGVAITEVVRRVARSHSGRIVLRAWFDSSTSVLHVEVVDGVAELDPEGGFPVVAALSTGWGAESQEEGATIWFDMQPRNASDRRGGRTA